MTRGRVLVALGVVVVLMAAFDTGTPLRPVLTLAFFCVAPGAAIVRRLELDEPLIAASLAIGISIAVSIAAAMVLLWTGVSSPMVAACAVLAVTAGALLAGAKEVPE